MTAEEPTVEAGRRRWRAGVLALAATALAVPGEVAFAETSPARIALPSPVGSPPSDDWQPTDPTIQLQLRVFLAGRDSARLTSAGTFDQINVGAQDATEGPTIESVKIVNT